MTINILRVYIILLLVSCNMFYIYSQSSVSLDNTIEMLPEKKVKVYLNESFRSIGKTCAKYYMITEFEDEILQLKGVLKCYHTINDNLYLTGNFNNGKLDGKFRSFYENGNLKMDFEYSNGNRNGIWQIFDENGQLIKNILYKNGEGFLLEFFDDHQKLIIKNGNGKYKDYLKMSLNNSYVTKVIGNVKNGLPDGEWNYYVNNVNIGKEYFKDFSFEKGISYSKQIGNSEYFDYYIATFTDIILIENLKLFSSMMCKNEELSFGKIFYDRFKKEYYNQEVNKIIKNGWFLIDISAGKNRKINKVKILSNSDENSISLIKDVIFKLENPFIGSKLERRFNHKSNFPFFPIAIKNSIPHNMFDDGGIELLSSMYN